MSPAEELILPFPAVRRPCDHARSTVLIGSLDAVRATGRFDAYVAALPREHHEALLRAVAGTWVPISVAIAHYTACDALGYSPDQELKNGRFTFDRAGTTIFGTVMKLAKGAGVTPWTLLTQMQRFWGRGYDGGEIAIYRLGPKEGRIEVVNVPLLDRRYYRNALRGILLSAMEMFCSKAYVTERPGRLPSTVTYRVQWA